MLIVVQGLELGNIGPDEATKGIESLQTSASQDISPSPEALQLQVQHLLASIIAPSTSACMPAGSLSAAHSASCSDPPTNGAILVIIMLAVSDHALVLQEGMQLC